MQRIKGRPGRSGKGCRRGLPQGSPPHGAARAFVGVLAELEGLKMEKLKLEIEWLKIQIAKDTGELIPVEPLRRGVVRLSWECRHAIEEQHLIEYLGATEERSTFSPCL